MDLVQKHNNYRGSNEAAAERAKTLIVQIALAGTLIAAVLLACVILIRELG